MRAAIVVGELAATNDGMSDTTGKRGPGRPRKPVPPPVDPTLPEHGMLVDRLMIMTNEVRRRLDWELERNPHEVPGRDWTEAYSAAAVNAVRLEKARIDIAAALKKQHGALTDEELNAEVSRAMAEYLGGMSDDEWRQLNEMRKAVREKEQAAEEELQ